MSAVAKSDGPASADDATLLPQPRVATGVLKAWLQRRLQSGPRLSFAIMVGAAIALMAGLAAAPLWQAASPQVTLELDGNTVFHSFPPFITELKHGRARMHVIRLAFAVAVPERQQTDIQAHEAAIEEVVRARLRDYDRRELQGNAGADRLREDILAIVNAAIAPAMASGVLFHQLILD
jgi:flagellar basal body-associated protein FliL